MSQLHEQIGGRDGIIVCEGTDAGDVHRLWLDLTSVFTRGDTAVLKRVREGERHLVRAIERALAGNTLSASSRETVGDLLTALRGDIGVTVF